MKNDYAPDILEVLNTCEEALLKISMCQFGTTKCTPNDSDFDEVRKALYLIAKFKVLRNLK